jgi:hypothetical protein
VSDPDEAVLADEAARRGWQQDGMIALLELLAVRSDGLLPPPIPWTVLTVGALLGRAESQGQVAAWAHLLDAEILRSPCADGSSTHRCDALWRGVPVTVIAD